MSFRSTLEFALHIDSFRNVDLIQQGVYQFSFTLFHQAPDGSKRFLALPYSVTPTFPYSSSGSSPKLTSHCLVPGYIKDQEHCFLSNAFIIRYLDEEVELGHLVQFRSELDLATGSEKTAYFLEIEMLFTEITAVGGPDYALSLFSLEGMNALTLRSVSKRTYKLVGASGDIFSGYIQAVFDEMHYSVLHLTVHSSILEYRLRQLPLDLQSPEANETEDEPVIKIVPIVSLPEVLEAKPLQSIGRKIDLAQYLFGDLEGNLPKLVSTSEADEAYEEYVATLSRVQIKLASKLTDLGQKILNEMDFKKMNLELKEGKENILIGEVKKRSSPSKLQKKLKFSEKRKVLSPQEVTKELTQELNMISGNILQLWYKYIDLVKGAPKRLLKHLSEDYTRMLNETFSYFICNNKIEAEEKMPYENYAEKHKKQAKMLRESNYFSTLQALPIQDQAIFGKVENIPLLFEDCYISKSSNPVLKLSKAMPILGIVNNQHLIVLVHGFQASSYDMRLIKDHLALLHPDAYFLCSCENERKTDGDIQSMGMNLSAEVRGFIKKNELTRLGKISFIGHSLGGVIIRAALPYLEEYKGKMHTFLTLSSPHLGYLFHASSLVNAGMWLLKTWQGSKCLEQLSFSDHKDLTQCFLYRLAHSKGLEWFKNVLLVNSFQDYYAPYESARIEEYDPTYTNTDKGKVHAEMVKVMMEKIKQAELYRIDIGFNINSKNVDNLIGRTAHILFLQNEVLMKIMAYRYFHLFK